ncbi:MAG: response regulator [Bauldia sp.]
MPAHAAFGLALDKLDVAVVDDSRPMQALICSMLTAYRVRRIRTFTDADHALQALTVDSPHLVIAEAQMSPTNGLALLRRARAPDRAPLCLTPFVLISAPTTRRVVEYSQRAGAHAFLIKPLSPSVLRLAIQRIVADSRQMGLTDQGYAPVGVDGQPESMSSLQEGDENLPLAVEDIETADLGPLPAGRGYGALLGKRR